MTKAFIKSFVAFSLLIGLIAIALPTLATASSAAPQRLAPGWTQISPPSPIPAARNDHAMAYDSARGVAVMFGGTDGFNTYSDVWEWSSSTFTWTEKQPATVPVERYGHAMVYDEARGVVVMFGGNGPIGTYLNDTFEWNGEGWTEVITADAPEGRWLHAMAYDPAREVVVLHSGQQTSTAGPYGDTWEYSPLASNWVKQEGISEPYPYRAGESMVYDRLRNVMVLFGGHEFDSGSDNRTSERIGNGDWQLVSLSPSPSGRHRAGMVFYERIGRTFLFGGLGDVYYGDTAVYNGQRWLGKYFDPRPSDRCCLAMVYDTQRKAVFLFGGSSGGLEQNDSWYFR